MVVQIIQLGLHFIHYYYPLTITKQCSEYHIYFMVEDRYIHNFTFAGNWTQICKTTVRRLETTEPFSPSLYGTLHFHSFLIFPFSTFSSVLAWYERLIILISMNCWRREGLKVIAFIFSCVIYLSSRHAKWYTV